MVALAEIKSEKMFYHLPGYSWMLFLQKHSLLKVFIGHQTYIKFCSKYGCLTVTTQTRIKKTIFIASKNGQELALLLNSVILTLFFPSQEEKVKARIVFLLFRIFTALNTMPRT